MDSKAFRSPPAEYLGAPFWVWNCKLDKQELLDQMDIFREMGMGGMTIHCRTGLATEYMGEEFMDIVKACIEKAKQCGMKLYLYDEDRWPSGFAGGKVTQDHELRMRYINFLPAEMADETDGPLLARYNIMLKDGLLVSYRRLSEGENGENVWEAHCKTRDVGSRFNGQSYVDTLNPKAIARFIELTHEAYYNLAGQEFGKTIPSIFSDEPQIMNKTTLETPESRQEVHMPYTPDFPESYRTVYGEDLFDTLPEVFWERADGLASQARYRYHQHALERFAAAFPDQIGRWCEAHGIAFTGHLMEEQNLRVLTVESGEPMRLYRGFTVPGIDMLCDAREYSTAKQCQSVVHQMGRSEMTSEVYGVTNWDFDFRSHKMQGDWQAALGVTHRVHHLAWASMAGEAKRDYPASIFFQSPWYERYRLIEEHFGRLNTVLQTGTPIVKIGVIHPIESYWLAFGPERQTAEVREALETQFSQTVEWLLFGQLDFDFIGEGLSETLESGQDKTGFRVGEMVYSVIVIPGCLTLRSSLMDRLEAFADAGGQILFMGNIPQYVDAVRSERPAKLAARCKQIPFDRLKLLAELEPYRTVRITGDTGVLCTEYLYQLRRDGDELFLFTTFGRRVDNPDAKNQNRNCQFNPDVPIAKSIVLSVPGTYEATLLDTMTGEQHALKVEHKNGWTYLHRALYLHDSLLLRLSPLTYNDAPEPPAPALVPVQVLDDVHSWKRDEPNVLMLDQAEYAWNSEKWHSREELLRIDTSLRQMCGLPVDAGDIIQPWAQPEPSVLGQVRLRFHFFAQQQINHVVLACEYGESSSYKFNGHSFTPQFEGYYIDPCLRTCVIGPVKAGENTLEITIPYTNRTSLEWCYLLGDFGVEVHGFKCVLTAPPELVGFGDLTVQGHPFYGGNFDYVCDVDVLDGEYFLEVDKFRCPVIACSVDGEEKGLIATAPYRVPLGHLAGKHHIVIKAYGNRVNTFGCVHNCDDTTCWFSPDAWRTSGSRFSYEYNLKRTGILKAPLLLRKVD